MNPWLALAAMAALIAAGLAWQQQRRRRHPGDPMVALARVVTGIRASHEREASPWN